MNLNLKGVFPALITPFTKNEEVDEDAFRKLIQFVMPHVNGVVVSGTTGESVYLSLEERERLYKIAVQTVEGKIPVIAGTGEASTAKTIQLTKSAEKVGVSACLVVLPYFLHPSPKGVHSHFLQVAKATELPLIMYNIPQVVDAVFPRQVIEDLAEVENIIAVKDSSGSLPYIMELLEFIGDQLTVLVGHDEIVVPALAAGCSGMILASAQVYPDYLQKILKAMQESKLDEARSLQRQIQKLARIFCRHSGPVAVKSALNMMGQKVGKARKPLKIGGGLSNEDREEIRIELFKIGKVEIQAKEFKPQEKELFKRFEEVELNEETLKKSNAKLGEGCHGTGNEKVNIDVVVGAKEGPVGEAFCYQMTHPRHSFEALPAILEPNLSVKPNTLLLPAIEQTNLRQANMIFGPAQLAISRAIVKNMEEKVIPSEMEDKVVMLIKTFIPPLAMDRKLVYENNYHAADIAIKQAFGGIK